MPVDPVALLAWGIGLVLLALVAVLVGRLAARLFVSATREDRR